MFSLALSGCSSNSDSVASILNSGDVWGSQIQFTSWGKYFFANTFGLVSVGGYDLTPAHLNPWLLLLLFLDWRSHPGTCACRACSSLLLSSTVSPQPAVSVTGDSGLEVLLPSLLKQNYRRHWVSEHSRAVTGLGWARCGLRPEFFSKSAFLGSWMSQRVMILALGSLSATKRS